MLDGVIHSLAHTVTGSVFGAQVFRHCDYAHLEELIQQADRKHRVVVVTDSLFSMDGDLADLQQLVALRQRYQGGPS